MESLASSNITCSETILMHGADYEAKTCCSATTNFPPTVVRLSMLSHDRSNFVQMGLFVLHGYVGGVIYYGVTLWILDMGSCLTLLGPTCLWRGLDSALCSYRTQALHGDVCLWRCRMNWSGLASQGEDVFFV